MASVLAVLAVVSAFLPGMARAQQNAPPTQADGAVATEIEHRLSDDRTVNAQNVIIEVRNGVVTLRGRVPSEHAKQQAGVLATSVHGVAEVRNQISAGSSPGISHDREPAAIPEKMPGAD